MASPTAIRELRFKHGTTFSTSFDNANAGEWAINATTSKVRVTAFDDSGLSQEGLPDETLETRMYRRRPVIPGLREGALTFSGYADGAYTNIDPTPSANLLRAALGGILSPTTSRTATAAGAGTTTNSPATSIDTYAAVGQAVLLGVKGDGRGNGAVRKIASLGTGWVEFTPAINAAQDAGDAIVVSTTTYLSEDLAQRYVDTHSIGHGAADQRQAIGCAVKVGISGTGPGELPKLDFELMPGDHQWVAAADRTTLSTDEPEGQQPGYHRGEGDLVIADYSSTSGTQHSVGDISVEVGVDFEAQPKPGGVNGKGGWCRIPGSPTIGMTLLIDEDFGLISDYESNQAKHVILQLGHTQGKCFAVEFQRAYLDNLPVPTALGNLHGMKIQLHGDEIDTASTEQEKSAIRIHQF